MHAAAGDWLIVSGGAHGHTEHRGKITAVQGVDGAPPYYVHWVEDDHEALVFPGPDARVVTADELAEHDRQRNERASAMQAAIREEAAHTG